MPVLAVPPTTGVESWISVYVSPLGAIRTRPSAESAASTMLTVTSRVDRPVELVIETGIWKSVVSQSLRG